MSRSGYSDDDNDMGALAMYRRQVASAIRGRRGQAFLRELAATLDAMPEKVLITGKLIDDNGNCCAIGVVCKARGIDVTKVDYKDPSQVAAAVGIARSLAAEIEYENDECGCFGETSQNRWQRMRRWVDRQLEKAKI